MNQARTIGFDHATVSGAAVAFGRWWRSELVALVPERVRNRWRARALLPILRVTPGAYVVEKPVLDNGRIAYRALARVAREAGGTGVAESAGQAAVEALRAATRGEPPTVMVTLPRGHALFRTLTLPLAVEENLREAVEFELDRLTPFRADQLYFDTRVLSRRADTRECTVALAYAQRRHVDELVNRLALWRLEVGAVVPEGAEASGLNLLPRAREEWSPAGVALSLVPWLLVVLLAAAAVAVPIWQKREAVIRLNAEAARARDLAQATDGLRKQAEELKARYDFLLAKKYAFPPAVAVIEELTRVFPDDTWLAQLDIRSTGRGDDLDRRVQMRGDTANAGQLISLLEGSSLISGAAPRSPTLKLQPGPGEAFDLAAKVKRASLPSAMSLAEALAARPMVIAPAGRPPAPAAPSAPEAVAAAKSAQAPAEEAGPVSEGDPPEAEVDEPDSSAPAPPAGEQGRDHEKGLPPPVPSGAAPAGRQPSEGGR